MLGNTQVAILKEIQYKPLTTKEITDKLESFNYSTIDSAVRRLEKRHLVARFYRGNEYGPAEWSSTRAGIRELDYNLRSN